MTDSGTVMAEQTLTINIIEAIKAQKKSLALIVLRDEVAARSAATNARICQELKLLAIVSCSNSIWHPYSEVDVRQV